MGTTTTQPTLQMIHIGDLQESPNNHRQAYPREAMLELTRSIKEKGILNPLLVRPLEKNGPFEILGGSRRFRAAKTLKLIQVPAIVRDLDDKGALEVMMIDNLQRLDIHPVEEASGYQDLIEKHGYDVQTLAAKVGKSGSYIYQRLKLADLIPKARTRFLKDEITAGHAILLARLTKADQEEALDWYGTSTPSVRSLAYYIRSKFQLVLSAAAFPKKDATLVPEAGSCDLCPKRTGFNRELFPDVGKEDLCTDSACFHKKQSAHLSRGLTALGPDGVLISTSYYRADANDIPDELRSQCHMEGSYTEAGGANKKCPHIVPALIVDGKRRGQSTKVCIDRKCKVHNSQKPAYSYSHRASSRAAQMKSAIQGEARSRALRKLLERTKDVTPELLRDLVLFVHESGDDPERNLPGSLEMLSRLRSGKGPVTTPSITKLLALGVYGAEPWRGLPATVISAAYRRAKVDLKKIQTAVRKEAKRHCPSCGKKPLSPGCSWPTCKAKPKGKGGSKPVQTSAKLKSRKGKKS